MALITLGACGDPAHDEDVASLGPEKGNVQPGPTHRPGQPCNVCHGGRGPAKAVFSMAGTVYDNAYDPMTPANGLAAVTVTLTDTTKKPHKTTTNGVGNFYVHSDEWIPAYPVHVQLDYSDGSTIQMQSHVGRDGSCAGCHHDPTGTASPGHVYLPIMTMTPATP